MGGKINNQKFIPALTPTRQLKSLNLPLQRAQEGGSHGTQAGEGDLTKNGYK